MGRVLLRLGACRAALRHAAWVSLPKSVGTEAQRWNASYSTVVASDAMYCVLASSAKRGRTQHCVLVAFSGSGRVVPRAFGFGHPVCLSCGARVHQTWVARRPVGLHRFMGGS